MRLKRRSHGSAPKVAPRTRGPDVDDGAVREACSQAAHGRKGVQVRRPASGAWRERRGGQGGRVCLALLAGQLRGPGRGNRLCARRGPEGVGGRARGEPAPAHPAAQVGRQALCRDGARVPCPRPLRGAPRVRRGDERRRRTRRQDQARASRRAQAVRLLARVVSRRARGGVGGEQAGGDAGWLAPAERRIRARPAHAGQHVPPRRHQRLGGDPAGGRRPHPRRDAPADPRAGGPRPGGAGGQRARKGSPHRRAALHAPARDSTRRARPHGAAARSLLRSAG
mmetsp:Transcript_2383/g.7876  ORF Transcript_2383/g.7876 Transcript_2383/m.7876 type:complete len:282 (+) Transcript_2383:119-964(+)